MTTNRTQARNQFVEKPAREREGKGIVNAYSFKGIDDGQLTSGAM